MPKQDDPYRKLHTCRGTNLDYDMLCQPTISYNEEKEGDNLSSNRLINHKIIDDQQGEFFSVPTMCTGEKYIDEVRRVK